MIVPMLKGISRSNRSERLYEKPGFTARRFQGRVFPSLLKIPTLRATLISFAPCLKAKVVAKTTRRNALIFIPEGCKAKRINIDKPVTNKNWLTRGKWTDWRRVRILTFLVLENLLVHHGYKFLNDEAWNLIAKRENKRCRAFLSIGTLFDH